MVMMSNLNIQYKNLLITNDNVANAQVLFNNVLIGSNSPLNTTNYLTSIVSRVCIFNNVSIEGFDIN